MRPSRVGSLFGISTAYYAVSIPKTGRTAGWAIAAPELPYFPFGQTFGPPNVPSCIPRTKSTELASHQGRAEGAISMAAGGDPRAARTDWTTRFRAPVLLLTMRPDETDIFTDRLSSSTIEGFGRPPGAGQGAPEQERQVPRNGLPRAGTGAGVFPTPEAVELRNTWWLTRSRPSSRPTPE
jgi:hypothetical protein